MHRDIGLHLNDTYLTLSFTDPCSNIVATTCYCTVKVECGSILVHGISWQTICHCPIKWFTLW